MTDQNDKHPPHHHVHAYDAMLARVRELMAQAQPHLARALDTAQEKAVALGELSREEADRIAGYLRRDLEDAAGYVAEHGEEFKDWLRIDLQLVEQHLFELTSHLVDQTRLQLDLMAIDAAASTWHTGEVTGMGTLQCERCDELLHFNKTSRIPPCPRCAGTVFGRPLPPHLSE